MDRSQDKPRHRSAAAAFWRAVGFVALAVVAPSFAWAGPGDHIVIGDAVITPSVSLGLEGRTNVYLAVGEKATGDERDAETPGLAFHLYPELAIKADGPEVAVDFTGKYELRKYFAESLSRLDRFSDFSTNLGLSLLPQRIVSFKLGDTAALRNFPSDTPFRESALMTQLRNDLTGSVGFKLGPTLALDLGGEWAFHDFRVPTADGQRGFNRRNEYGPTAALKWMFFPRTALVLEGAYSWHRWDSNWIPATGNRNGVGLGEYLGVPDSQHFKLQTGLRGRITERLVVSLLVGYGFANYDEDSVADDAADDPPANANEADGDVAGFDADVNGAEGVLALARAEYDLGRGHRVNVQYRKDFIDSFFTNYVAYHDLSAGYGATIGRFEPDVRASIRFEHYNGEVDRRDIFLRVQGDAAYNFTDWMSLSGGVWWVQRASEFPDIQYDDVNLHVATTFTY